MHLDVQAKRGSAGVDVEKEGRVVQVVELALDVVLFRLGSVGPDGEEGDVAVVSSMASD